MILPGLMQPTPLTLRTVFDRMRTVHASKEVVSVLGSGPDRHVVRHTNAELAERVLRLCRVLTDLGIGEGDRVATFAFNSHRHLELYWAVPLVGAVLHTVNVRLYEDQVRYIIDHADDRIVFFDGELAEAAAAVAPHVPRVQHWVAMGPCDGTPPEGTLDHEVLVGKAEPVRPDELPDVREDAACGLCYTSGTTGMPKGVLSSHRGMWLHSLATCTADSIGLRETDRVLPVVPLFHAFGWGLPYSAAFCGADIVLHGSDSSAGALSRLLADERVTVAAGVPTIWKDLLPSIEDGSFGPDALRLVFVGGSASPASLIDAYLRRGIEYLQVWGMTETGPLAATSRPRARHSGLPDDELLAVRERTGTIMSGLEARIVDDHGVPLPWDGASVGELEVRGPWIASAYHDSPEFTAEKFADGWLRTGDMAWMEPDGYFRIVDRAKDLVKSGGEWISTVELEGALLAHPAVRDAAVVACRSKKWDERPAAVIVLADGAEAPTLEDLRDFLAPDFARWWLPDHLELVDDIPKTSVGKLDKKVLRARLDHVELP